MVDWDQGLAAIPQGEILGSDLVVRERIVACRQSVKECCPNAIASRVGSTVVCMQRMKQWCVCIHLACKHPIHNPTQLLREKKSGRIEWWSLVLF